MEVAGLSPVCPSVMEGSCSLPSSGLVRSQFAAGANGSAGPKAILRLAVTSVPI